VDPGVSSFGDTRPRTVGILGAGRVGTAVARQALRAGLDVQIAASGDPADIRLIIEVMAPGAIAVTAADAASSSEMVQDFLVGARLVKTLNHIGYHELESDHSPVGTPGRRALAVAGDDAAARAVVMALVERLGYDAVDAGVLADGVVLEPGTEIFTGSHDRAGLEALLAAHSRQEEANA
jgi:predicted dinucleotide-binding enzyme